MTVPHSNQYHPRAKRRVRDLAAEYADKVDSTLVSNTIHERVPEDEFILKLADVVERLDDLQERAGATDSELRSPLRTAMYHLTSDVDEAVVRKRVETVVDEILADLEEEVEEWDDAWSDEKIGEAKQELRHIRETGDRCRTRGD